MPTLGIFAKRPVPGAVKTRLAATIGADQAARFYEVSLRTLLTRVRGLDLRRVIAVAHPEEWPPHPGPLPPSHVQSRGVIARGGEGGRVDTSEPLSPNLAWFQQFKGYELWPQPAGGLGEKLAAWFDFACAADDRVLVIGSDSPTLPLQYIADAIAALDTTDCVIGPAHDGGYYLLGLQRPVPQLFEGIEWSGPQVFSQTLERAAEQGLRVIQLPAWNDIDEVADLPLLHDQLTGLSDDPVWNPLSTVVQDIMSVQVSHGTSSGG